jgi:uncharacterized protein YbaR (Trm112 family)
MLPYHVKVGLERSPSGKRLPMYDKTANYTIALRESGSVFSNRGAAGAVTFTLPQNADRGVTFSFSVQAAQEIRVSPGARGAIYISGAKQTDNKYVSFDDEGEHLTLVCNGDGDWFPIASFGTFTVQV